MTPTPEENQDLLDGLAASIVLLTRRLSEAEQNILDLRAEFEAYKVEDAAEHERAITEAVTRARELPR